MFLKLSGFIILILASSCTPNSTGNFASYLYLTEADLINVSSSQGSASHNITDAWVYADGELVGVFELPAKVPIISEGETTIEISPGIMLNGIASTRIIYPFYDDLVFTLDMEAGKVDTLNMHFEYKSNVQFALIEDFESGNSFSNIDRVTGESPNVYEGNASGFVTVDTINFQINSQLIDAVNLPGGGVPVFAEINYKSNARFLVGINTIFQGNEREVFILGISQRENWNKIYVNLTPQTTQFGQGEYRLIFRTELPAESDEAIIFLDNIKLLHL
ncbi:MAG: hypothetical protein EA412_06255 [Chitinophagaceae bacterium]|nr:MAG: hypothetical protein EA412_06255 [Chitinophagaceae bacterium]